MEGYGETLGNEYYMYFGNFTERGDSSNTFHRDLRLQYAYYKGNMYYLKNGYIWKSKEDGASPEVIRKMDQSMCKQIFVNACGIYIFDGSKIVAYDFHGKEKASIEPYGEICSYYICDNRVFLITRDEDKVCSAVWFDIDTQVFHEIYTTKGEVELGVNSAGERSYKERTLNYIMANQKRALIWMDFIYYFYPDDMENEECLENEAAGWYSYDFETKKFQCVNCKAIYPHECDMLPKKFGDFRRREEYRKQWTSIAFFDMKRDLMWVRRRMDDFEAWEPRRIGNIEKTKILEQMPVWIVREGLRYSPERIFFDGKRRYQTKGFGGLYSYDKSGIASANLYQARYDAAHKFQISGDYIFYVDDSCGNEKQFSLENVPCPLRENWMQSRSPEQVSEEEQMAIDYFLNGKKLPDKAPAPSGNIVKKISASGSGSGTGAAKVTYLEYWTAFAEYAFERAGNKDFQDAKFPKAAPADRNWYALRLGSSLAHIELSFSIKKKTARTALFIKDKQIYNYLESNQGRVNAAFCNVEGHIAWDGVSKSSSVSIVRDDFDMNGNRKEQFEWFMKCACLLKVISKLVVS